MIENKLQKDSVVKDFFTTAADGKSVHMKQLLAGQIDQ